MKEINQRGENTQQPWVTPLLQWYDSHARDLPWRKDPNPYKVWVSEIMLQQTRVEAGKAYFERFLEALPDVEALANVSDPKLMKLWEGLGYYSRARNLKKTAGIVMEQYSGSFPGEYEALLGLPGIGSYSAGAIGSIAFGLPVPAVDGNVLRVMARLSANREDIADPKTKRRVEQELGDILPKERPGDFNQALMELGATVCLPNGTPRCDLCPIQGFCLAKKEGTQKELPVKAKKKARRIEYKTVLILWENDSVLLTRRPGKGLLAGMYQLPNLDGHPALDEVVEHLNNTGFRVQETFELPKAVHIFSHVEWRMRGYRFRVMEKPKDPSYIPADHAMLETEVALPSAFQAFRPYLFPKMAPRDK